MTAEGSADTLDESAHDRRERGINYGGLGTGKKFDLRGEFRAK